MNSARLNELKVGALALTPTFDKDVEEYSATTENDSNKVTATPEHEEAEVVIKVGDDEYESGDTITWETGENEVEVTVTNGSDTKTYTITVTKAVEPSEE